LRDTPSVCREGWKPCGERVAAVLVCVGMVLCVSVNLCVRGALRGGTTVEGVVPFVGVVVGTTGIFLKFLGHETNYFKPLFYQRFPLTSHSSSLHLFTHSSATIFPHLTAVKYLSSERRPICQQWQPCSLVKSNT